MGYPAIDSEFGGFLRLVCPSTCGGAVHKQRTASRIWNSLHSMVADPNRAEYMCKLPVDSLLDLLW